MHFPDGMDPGSFLSQHWQKSPLFMAGAFGAIEPELDPDELAWLATLPDVESRLVFTESHGDSLRYRVSHGPFDETELTGLPDRDWTLLVHDVDKHLPDFRDFFRHVDFIPDWRVDDLMVSFAAPGGSVGPHRDNYDVFLVQGSGRREWRLTASESVRPDAENTELSLLQPFDGDRKRVVTGTDVLYLPPGVPHWGIALDRCMTYSIGMRAPERAEFACASERFFPARGLEVPDRPADRIFYEDPDLAVDEAAPGLIDVRSLRRARQRFDAKLQFNDDDFVTIFGSLVTDPKAWLEPERPDDADSVTILTQLAQRAGLQLHGMARVAYTRSDESMSFRPQIFANGFCRPYPEPVAAQISRLCRVRGLNRSDLGNWLQEPELRSMLLWLVRQGVFELSDE
jgi:50S ribosomal protein L16 3-hydroxylase